jgi:hypothetical protein
MRSRVKSAIGVAVLGALAWIPPAAGAAGSAAPAADAGLVVGTSFTAHINGDVTSVDPQSGKLVVNTADGPVTAVFPPIAVQDVKPGDHVTLAVGLVAMPETSPSASPITAPDSSSDAGPAGSR